ncbi:Ig-like domain-containing protein, partial [Sulfurimonas sp.]
MKYILHLLLLTTLTLSASSSATQTHLLSLSPEPSAKDISADTLIEVKYDLNISKHSLYEGAIVLKNTKHKKIEGTLSIKNKNTLLFTPDELLKSGEYRVKVKPINLQDYTLNTRFSKYAK